MSLDVYLENVQPVDVFSQNITHNLGGMAEKAGIYEVVWRPDENEIKEASQLIVPLRKAIKKMKEAPIEFKKLDSPNGWGKYEHFLPWLEKYLEACEKYPDATVRVSR